MRKYSCFLSSILIPGINYRTQLRSSQWRARGGGSHHKRNKTAFFLKKKSTPQHAQPPHMRNEIIYYTALQQVLFIAQVPCVTYFVLTSHRLFNDKKSDKRQGLTETMLLRSYYALTLVYTTSKIIPHQLQVICPQIVSATLKVKLQEQQEQGFPISSWKPCPR